MTREEIDNLVVNQIISIANEDNSIDEIQRNKLIKLSTDSYWYCTENKNKQELIEYIENSESDKCIEDYIKINIMTREEIDNIFKEAIIRTLNESNTMNFFQRNLLIKLSIDGYRYCTEDKNKQELIEYLENIELDKCLGDYMKNNMLDNMTREESNNIFKEAIIRALNESSIMNFSQRTMSIKLIIDGYRHCIKDKNKQELIEYLENIESDRCLDNHINSLSLDNSAREEIDNIFKETILRDIEDDNRIDETQQNLFANLILDGYQYCTKDKNVQELIKYIENVESNKCLKDYTEKFVKKYINYDSLYKKALIWNKTLPITEDNNFEQKAIHLIEKKKGIDNT